MLVLSRRETETIVFPAINTTVQLVKVRGKVARIGIKAPEQLQILRGELAEDGMQWFPGEEGDLFEQTHEMRNRLNVATVGLTLTKRLLDSGKIVQAKATLQTVVDRFVEAKSSDDVAALNGDGKLMRVPRALLVEDDANERHLMAGLLRTSGFHVDMAGDGVEALGRLAEGPRPDIVLMDMAMPECDGPTAVRAIRSDPQHAGLRIYAISGKDPDALGLDAGPTGIDRWIQKPVNAEDLVDQLTQELTPVCV